MDLEINRGPPPRARGRRPHVVSAAALPRTTPASAGTTATGSRWRSRSRDHPRERGDDMSRVCAAPDNPGPPPRARGRPGLWRERPRQAGTTPASAGTTGSSRWSRWRMRDHPRERGDDPPQFEWTACRAGPPPRARGRPAQGGRDRAEERTTPASAGTTLLRVWADSPTRDHPRERGDDVNPPHLGDLRRGPPPRARGRPQGLPRRVLGQRTTPASAGTTSRAPCSPTRWGDHPRERGDDAWEGSPARRRRGPPPRARGRRTPRSWCARRPGTTPASAGTTTWSTATSPTTWDHPRQRGDDVGVGVFGDELPGPPPPARGRPPATASAGWSPGTTPASAGTTARRSRPGCADWDHPRQRGDDPQHILGLEHPRGPPPPARGRRHPGRGVRRGRRTTPASAGTTACRSRSTTRGRDHPRQRGDDFMPSVGNTAVDGPPPPARGRRLLAVLLDGALGTTPASAGTTTSWRPTARSTTDHPRQRGDDGLQIARFVLRRGPPPPARGRLSAVAPAVLGAGTTPASAGTTSTPTLAPRGRRDHPRQRGDDAAPQPPAGSRRRTTPASAGTTHPIHRSSPGWQDHPRQRGDDPGKLAVFDSRAGPPPPARGRPSLLS